MPGQFEDDANLPEHLYHYTSADGLHGILESNSLYATHAGYLNDSQELVYGMQMVRDELTKWVKKTPDDAKAGWDPALPKLLISAAIKATALVLAAELEKKTQMLRQNFGPFVTCLSESRDQLSQWRGYGKGGGYAIKFETEQLRSSVHGSRVALESRYSQISTEHGVPVGPARFTKMLYEPAAQIPLIRSQLMSFVNAFAARLKMGEKLSPEESALSRTELVDPLLSWLVAMATRIKDPGFAEELEYRISTFFAAELFSPGDTGLVPRTSFTFDPSCVKEILIGPGLHMDTRESSVRYYLGAKVDPNGTPGKFKYQGVEVTVSKTPYRGQ